jgi:hypothetical protein
MAQRPIFTPKYLLTNASMAVQQIAGPSNIEQVSCISYDISWTGAPVGTFAIQVSNTYVPNPSPGNLPLNPGTWTTIPQNVFTGVYPTPAGTPSNGALDFDVTGFTWVQLVYTPTSGSGSLTVVVSGKVA